MKRGLSLSATEIKKLIVQNLRLQLKAQGYSFIIKHSGSSIIGNRSRLLITIGTTEFEINVSEVEK